MSINHQNNGLTTSCNYLPECFWCIITLPLHASPNGVWPVQGTISSNENRVVNLPQRDEDYEDYEDYEDFGSNLLGQTSFAEGIILAIGVVLLRDIYIHVLTSTRGN